MLEILKLLIAGIILILGIPIGNLLRKYTKDEIKDGKKYFKLIIILSTIIGFFGLIFNSDVIMFTFFFIAIVTSRNL